MNIDRKTSIRVSFYNEENKEIHSWPFYGSIRIALLVSTLTGEKEKLERGDLTDEQKKAVYDYVLWDVKRFLDTPYTTDNA